MADDARAISPKPDAAAGPASAGEFAVVDDLTGTAEAIDWAAGELVSEKTPEAVESMLRENGWQGDQVDQIMIEALARTKAERGVPDYSNALHRARENTLKGNGGWMIGWPVWASFRRLVLSVRSLRLLSRKR